MSKSTIKLRPFTEGDYYGFANASETAQIATFKIYTCGVKHNIITTYYEEVDAEIIVDYHEGFMQNICAVWVNTGEAVGQYYTYREPYEIKGKVKHLAKYILSCKKLSVLHLEKLGFKKGF